MKTPFLTVVMTGYLNTQNTYPTVQCTLFMIMRFKMLKVRVKMLIDVVMVMRVVMEMSVE